MKKKLLQLKEALSYLENNKILDLNKDTFLCGKELDGSDKLYGFARYNNELRVITRSCDNGYPIDQMDKSDLDYIFKGSALILPESIYQRILNKHYQTNSL